MSWAEARERIGQEFAKRRDLAAHRTGLGLRTPHLLPQAAGDRKFFFGSDEGEPAHRAALLRQYLPQAAKEIVNEADEIIRHQFHLLGYGNLDYGPSIDWHCDPVHGKRSPLSPWFKINFLDFQRVGDHKIIWELNRHQHLVTLAKAWLLTGNQLYTDELMTQWYSWRKENPYPFGINWASALEVAFRSLSWLWIRNLLSGSLREHNAFETDLLLALQLNGRYIERYLSTYFSPNTHLLGEGVALFFIGTLCPELSTAQRWQEMGWKIVLKESERQVRPDGVYFEQSLYYHVYALDFFLHARTLAGNNGCEVPEQFDNVLKRMLDVVHALGANGAAEGFGDDDGGRVFNPRRNRAEHMTDPLALGAILYDCDKYDCAKYVTEGVTEEAIWLFGDRATQWLGKRNSEPLRAAEGFASGGIYLIRNHQPCAQQLMIDAGRQGEGRSGHGHADALSLRLSLDGRRFLIDPGTYCYICESGERDGFRGTSAHNTLSIDSVDQAVPAGPFGWSSIPNVKAETWLNGETFNFFSGNHDGYRRLAQPVMHRRAVFHLRSGLWFVRDLAEGEGNHLLEIFWHFAPGITVTKKETGIISAQLPSGEKNTTCTGLTMLTVRDSVWKTEIAEGFVSPTYGSKQIAPTVRMRAEVALPADCGVLLLPMIQASETGTLTFVGENKRTQARGYRYQTQQSAEYFFFASGGRRWECGPWAGDPTFLYCKLNGSRLQHVIMVSGSFAEWRGKRFISRSSPVASFEWLSHRVTASATDQQEVISEFGFIESV